MAKRLMSDAEMRRRQKLQGKIGRTTSTLGLAGLGVTGAAALASRNKGALKAIKMVPGLKGANPENMRNAAINAGIVSGGIGGVGGFNQASIYSAESRKRNLPPAAPVRKDMAMGIEMGYYGEEGRPVPLAEIEAEVEKAWSPAASNFDSEASRHKRSKVYQGGALVGAGAGGLYAGHHGMQAAHHASKVKVVPHAVKLNRVTESVNRGGTKFERNVQRAGKASTKFPALDLTSATPALKHGGKALAGVAAVGAAAGVHSHIKRKEKSSWQSYAKRSTTSAFGIDHMEWTAP